MKNLISKYVECALACRITPIETIFRGIIKGPLAFLTNSGNAKQFAGLTAFGSGSTYVTQSTTLVTSGMLINLALLVNTTVASGSGGCAIAVSSIVDGVSFAMGYTDGVGRGPGGSFMWELRRTR